MSILRTPGPAIGYNNCHQLSIKLDVLCCDLRGNKREGGLAVNLSDLIKLLKIKSEQVVQRQARLAAGSNPSCVHPPNARPGYRLYTSATTIAIKLDVLSCDLRGKSTWRQIEQLFFIVVD